MELHYLHKDPIQQFHDWFKEAELKSGLKYPNAMSLASVGEDGQPSVRIVLLKGVNHDGFVFFTNYESQKGQEVLANPRAALCFYWDACHRQVRVQGKIEKISKHESQEYFSSRPRGSQIGAWASPQSREISSREELLKKHQEMELKFKGLETIPVPDHWGGFLLRPERIEFWQEQENRLHDRFVYSKTTDWQVKRVAP